MFNKTIIGVDLGGTKIGVGKVEANQIATHFTFNVSSQASEEKILDEIIQAIEKVFDQTTAGIGVGAPSLVDVEKGIVYDVQNIPSWKKVHLKQILEDHFHFFKKQCGKKSALFPTNIQSNNWLLIQLRKHKLLF